MTLENLEIRMMVNDAGIKYKDIAKHMGISRVHLSRLMSYKLSKKNEKRIISAINDIKNCIDKETYTSVVVPVEWIPCSERLPEVGQYCFITLKDRDVNMDKYCSYGWHNYGDEVLAWMPLPEPYEGD